MRHWVCPLCGVKLSSYFLDCMISHWKDAHSLWERFAFWWDGKESGL